MTLEALRPEPCWELPHHVDEQREVLPHYDTRAMAIAARIAEMRSLSADYDDADDEDLKAARKVLMKSRPTQAGQVCCRLVCDSCHVELEDDWGDLHLRADDVTAEFLRDRSWRQSPDGRTHQCPDCPPTQAELEHEARTPGPDDVPLFPLTGEGPA